MKTKDYEKTWLKKGIKNRLRTYKIIYRQRSISDLIEFLLDNQIVGHKGGTVDISNTHTLPRVAAQTDTINDRHKMPVVLTNG